MDRIELERKLNESREWLLATYSQLSKEELRRPLTTSEHDPENRWSALDHFAHLALIERNFVAIARRHLAGKEHPVGLANDETGRPRTREEVMASVHSMTEEWQRAHHDDAYEDVVALTLGARSATLELISDLSEAQLNEVIPGAPWADGTVGGVLGANAEHAQMHWHWVTKAGLLD